MSKRLTGIVVLLLIGTMLLTGCDILAKKDGGSPDLSAFDNAGDSGKASETPDTSKKPDDKQNVVDTPVASETPVETPVETPEETPAETPEETPGGNTSDLARGAWDSNNVYTSEFASVTFAMPDDWVYGTDQEIASLMNVGMDVLSEAGMSFSKKMLEQQSIYDMMARNAATNSNVMLMYENLSMVVGGSMLTIEQYIEALKGQLDQAAKAGLNYTIAPDVVSYTLCGKEYQVLATTLDAYGVEQYYFLRKIDSYILGIIISVYPGDDVDTILEYFV